MTYVYHKMTRIEILNKITLIWIVGQEAILYYLKKFSARIMTPHVIIVRPLSSAISA